MVFVYRYSGKRIVLVFAYRPRQILGYFPAFYFEILWRALGYYSVIRMETQTKVRLLSPTVTPANIGLVQTKIRLLSWSSHRENQANIKLRSWHPPTENQANKQASPGIRFEKLRQILNCLDTCVETVRHTVHSFLGSRLQTEAHRIRRAGNLAEIRTSYLSDITLKQYRVIP